MVIQIIFCIKKLTRKTLFLAGAHAGRDGHRCEAAAEDERPARPPVPALHGGESESAFPLRLQGHVTSALPLAAASPPLPAPASPPVSLTDGQGPPSSSWPAVFGPPPPRSSACACSYLGTSLSPSAGCSAPQALPSSTPPSPGSAASPAPSCH